MVTLREQHFLLLVLLRRRQQVRLAKASRKPRRWWVRPPWRLRAKHGQFATLLKILRQKDGEYYFRFMRMSPERFDELMELIRPHLIPRKKRRPDQISGEERLAITLRYLATGDSQSSESFNFLAGRSTVCGIIREVCTAIWEGLRNIYLKSPSTSAEYLNIANEFEEQWDLPHVIGAVDGKHIQIECPRFGGSDFYNRKGFHSTILMAVCDANYSFTHVSLGSYGKESDATIFSNTPFYQRLDSGEEDIPPPSEVDHHTLPYCLVGDDIFPLKTWLMQPYPGSQSDSVECQIFNFRLSRDRLTIENAFGILSAKWRVFRRPIRAEVATIDRICQACLCLHNFLLLTDNAGYLPTGFVDSYTVGGEIVEGNWRKLTSEDTNPCLRGVSQQGSRNYATTAKSVRDNFRALVNGPRQLDYQMAYVTYSGTMIE